MDLKELLGKGLKKGGKKRGRRPDPERGKDGLSVDDLITLKQYGEAESRLRDRIKANVSDLRSRLKLADVYMDSGRKSQAVEEYIAIADSHARDGFYDKAIALLSKVQRLVPHDEKTTRRLERLRRAKDLEHRRSTVSDALIHREAGDPVGRSGVFEVQKFWNNLTNCHLLERLDEEQLASLFGVLELSRLEEGAEVARKGQRLEELYIVAEGGVEALLELSGGATTVIRGLEPGDVFGERALLQRQAWAVTYRANARTTLLKLTRESLEKAMHGDSDPRRLLDALREQQLDGKVAAAVASAQSS
jgi:tetratricopeptide (TPR) repeat protein